MRTAGLLGLLLGLGVACVSLLPRAHATPWIEADDAFLRASIEQLAAAGYLRGHRNTYPLMWGGISRDLSQIDVASLSEEHLFAFYRVRAALEFSQRTVTRTLKASVGTEHAPENIHLNTFADASHERAAITSGTSFTGHHWAGRLQTTFKAKAADGKRYDFAGSYLATTIGNWAFSADQLAVWWGPAHENALVLSSNSMPIQALRINRLNDASPPVMSWLGPWHATAFVGRTQSSASLGDNYVGGGRMTIRPFQQLELGASYVGHWENLDHLYNQMAGLDARLVLARRMSVYTEVATNHSDADAFAYTVGVDRRFSQGNDRIWQVYAEHTDVPEFFYDRSALHGDVIEQNGYRRWGYAIGAGQDQDVSATSLGIQTQHSDGRGWSVKIRHAEYGATNRPNVLRFGYTALEKVTTYQLDVAYQRPLKDSLLTVGVGYRYDDVTRAESALGDMSERVNELSFKANWEFRF